jgi:hypothetical protein
VHSIGGIKMSKFELALNSFWAVMFESKCEYCGEKSAGLCIRYCTHCGELNPSFDESTFIANHRYTLQEAIAEECAQGHPDVHDSILDFPDFDENYCQYCGVDIDQYRRRLLF